MWSPSFVIPETTGASIPGHAAVTYARGRGLADASQCVSGLGERVGR